jgi:hypothetical protein
MKKNTGQEDKIKQLFDVLKENFKKNQHSTFTANAI